MPYFLKQPFSCAITIGEQSVSAIMPKRMSVDLGRGVGRAPARARPQQAHAAEQRRRAADDLSPMTSSASDPACDRRAFCFSMPFVLPAPAFPMFFADHRWS